MAYDITKQQEKILNYIRNEVNSKGYPPSVREICAAVGLKSTSTVHGHLSKLEKHGYIRRDPTKPRAIEVLDNDDGVISKKEVIEIPVIGKVTAGLPILAVENIEDTFPVPLDFLDDNKHFMLTIKGSSMINAGIFDGDYVLVKQQQIATNGDIVVAMIEDEATVKKFYKEKDYIRLQPENPSMVPIITKDVRILGLVTGVFRKI
ncbi:transcriptional repressor LexA [Marinisporobacter balticus]|uniref:LexA repressor n=1 Tax=Marinisporobacter balticus TaxID=2018667 RepID=A0A4R2KZ64_9FIRM|nr:transcriptional repressor LexA [Marinisporobacter balticus]TCO79213.1 SOS-response transcriptional repressor LexA [Marinisporobacter balticus]